MELYLSSLDGEEWAELYLPNKILHLSIVLFEGKEILKTEIETPIIGQKYGLLDCDVSTLYLVHRFVGDEKFDINGLFPYHVHVLIPKSKYKLIPDSLSDLQNIIWACLHNNYNHAKAHKLH